MNRKLSGISVLNANETVSMKIHVSFIIHSFLGKYSSSLITF